MVNIDKQELIGTAWGLANSKQLFLWVIRPGEIGCVVKWTPQKEVLAHAAVGGIQPLRVFVKGYQCYADLSSETNS
ncbi:hypothetical protein Goklo_022713 [Gossypium klotzschianum]|uniref:Uncharacterized protein n=1 Tax=Gossypium klotzschianum TaxID=34286 RepID=A0A7J8TNB8_9ROSI|nr:hypothetical protein [Gossypium klotzschianum]